MHFEDYGLKRLITTCYKNQDVDLFSTQQSEQAVYLVYDGDKNGNGEVDVNELDIRPLKGDGDFRSAECVELLKQADIVVTNPPFSLFREYVAQLMRYQKKFLIIANKGAIGYKEVFHYFKENKIWVGCTPMSVDLLFELPQSYIENFSEKDKGSKYRVEDGKILGRSPSIWITNLDHNKRHEPLIMIKKYNPEFYPTYYNFGAIDVNSVDEIPEDYYGMMGVPITIMDKYCPEQFEIIGLGRDGEGITVDRSMYPKIKEANPNTRPSHIGYFDKNGKPKEPFSRIIIRRKQQTP